eukprot:scaffold109788_cov51-Phaeocystis_antarctica.AAC.2
MCVSLQPAACSRQPASRTVTCSSRMLPPTSLAQRVAAERGGRVGGVVGYAVRLESRRSADTRLLFCTTGVLLRRLQDPSGGLGGLTHVVVDEVHRRSLDGDLALAVTLALTLVLTLVLTLTRCTSALWTAA